VLFYPAGSTTATRVYGQGGDFTTNTINKGGISADSLSFPRGLALDSGGNLYVGDAGNHRVLFYPAGEHDRHARLRAGRRLHHQRQQQGRHQRQQSLHDPGRCRG
jgi:hypothetical protein